jgi:hypothetical protein
VKVWPWCRAEKKRGEMRARERIKEVEEGSWTCCGTKKGHGQAGAVAGGRRHAWRLRATAARRGGAGKSQWGSGERRAGELEGQVVGLERRGAAGSAGDHRRGAAGGAAEQLRGRGERKTTGTCSKFFKSSRGSLGSKIFFQTIAQMNMCPKAKV